MLRYRCYARKLIGALAALSLVAAMIPLYAYATSADGAVDLPLDSSGSTVNVTEQPATDQGDPSEGGTDGEGADQDAGSEAPEDDAALSDSTLEAAAASAVNVTIPLNVQLATADGSSTLKLSQDLPATLEGHSSFQNNSKSTVYISDITCSTNSINTVFTGAPTLTMNEVAVQTDNAQAADANADAADANSEDAQAEPTAAPIQWTSEGNGTGSIFADDAAQPAYRFKMESGQLVGVGWQLGLEGSSFNLEQLAQAGLDTSQQMITFTWTFAKLES